MIVLFSSSKDLHAQEILKELKHLGHDSQIFYTDQDNLKNTTCSCNGHRLLVQQGSYIINIQNIKIAFVLSPIFPFFSSTQTNFQQNSKFWYFTWKETLFGIYAILAEQGRIINASITSAMNNQNKLQYHHLLKSDLLKFPDFYIGNKKQDAIHFIHQHNEVVIKTLHQMQLSLPNGEPSMLLVNKIQTQDLNDFEENAECPIFLQKFIPKIYDLRIIVIGNRIFTCKIDANLSEAGKVDWRAYDLPRTPHTAHQLTAALESEIFKICRSLQLEYATLDLCVDDNGQHWILDINPFGKYLWIEDAIGSPITHSIAQYLIQRSQSIAF